MAVDWGRYPYSTPARLGNSPLAPVVSLDWYETDLPFQDFPSAINQRKNDTQVTGELLLGELPYQYPPPYNGRGPVPGLTGGHRCGFREWFQDGYPYPYLGEPIVYDGFGIPLCCGRPVEPTGGGVVLGGAAGDALAFADPAAGGVQLGGEAGDVQLNLPNFLAACNVGSFFWEPGGTYDYVFNSPGAAVFWFLLQSTTAGLTYHFDLTGIGGAGQPTVSGMRRGNSCVGNVAHAFTVVGSCVEFVAGSVARHWLQLLFPAAGTPLSFRVHFAAGAC